jgi:hypothetical protein
VFAASPEVLSVAVTEALPPAATFPLVGDSVSQPRLSDALHDSGLPPLFEIVIVCAGGEDPTWPLITSAEGATASTAGGGVTTSVTGMVFGEFVAPAAVTVIVPL